MHGKRIFQALLGLIALGAGLFLVQSPANASTPLGPWVIIGYDSKKCVEDPDYSNTNNLTMEINSCASSPRHTNQQWFWDDFGGWYRIRNAHNGKCLVPKSHLTTNNTAIVQSDCNSDYNQWTTRKQFKDGKDYYWVINTWSGRCLTVKNGSRSNGGTLVQYDCNQGGNEVWTWGP